MVSGTANVVMGERGRLVIPQEIRERAGLEAGTQLIVLETADGLMLLTRAQLLARVRADLAGPSMVEELIADRREAARLENQ